MVTNCVLSEVGREFVYANLICDWPCIINVGKVIQKNQLDATITIYWSPRSAQHDSGNLLPIFRIVRQIFAAYGIVSCCFGRLGFGERQHGTTCWVGRMKLIIALRICANAPRTAGPEKNVLLSSLIPPKCWFLLKKHSYIYQHFL